MSNIKSNVQPNEMEAFHWFEKIDHESNTKKLFFVLFVVKPVNKNYHKGIHTYGFQGESFGKNLASMNVTISYNCKRLKGTYACNTKDNVVRRRSQEQD